MKIQEFIKQSKHQEYYSDLLKGYNYWGESLDDFNLSKDDWDNIFIYMQEGTYEMNRKDAKDEYIINVGDECFYGTYLVEYYTIPAINDILTANKYEPINVEKDPYLQGKVGLYNKATMPMTKW